MIPPCLRVSASPRAAVLCALLSLSPSPLRSQVSPPLASDTSWVRTAAIYEIFVRSFSPTGDFRGVIQGLDRIQATGANVIWLMPIHPVGTLNRKDPLGSPYSVRDYRAVNPAFGTLDDFKALVQAVHARGMKIIIDWVPNHTSWDNVWVQQHPDFYVRNDAGQMTVPRDEKGNLTDWTDVAQLNYRNPGLRREMISAMQYWLRDINIDGFRMDVAGFVPDDFWREATAALRSSVDRPVLLLAEWGDRRMHRNGFDLSYSWDMYGRLKRVWTGARADSFVVQELADADSLPRGGMRLRFTTNHDETGWDQPPVTLFKGPAGARAAFVAAAFLPGRPLLYNGQEVESPQKLRLFYNDTIAWTQPNASDARAFYHRVVTLLRTDSAFITGDFRDVETSAEADVIAYQRGDVIVLVNVRDRPVAVTVRNVPMSSTIDLFRSRFHHGNAIGLPAYGTAVLRVTTRR